jgi:hypothetical protein
MERESDSGAALGAGMWKNVLSQPGKARATPVCTNEGPGMAGSTVLGHGH